MTTDDKYEGWTNVETWALDLLLSKDVGLYNLTRERVADARAEYVAGYSEDDGQQLNDILPHLAGEAVQSVWEEMTDPDSGFSDERAVIGWLQEVGSDWRINWDEIGAAWLEDQS